MARDVFGPSGDVLNSNATFGLLGNRPPATSVGYGFVYFATDDNGGTTYRSDGATWYKQAPGALETGGRELAYNEKTDANFVTTNTAATDIGTGTSITFTAGARPVAIRFGCCDFSHSVANTLVLFQAIRTDTSFVLHTIRGSHATAGNRVAAGSQQARMSGLTPGQAYTVKLQTLSGAAGTTTVFCSPNQPIWIQALEL